MNEAHATYVAVVRCLVKMVWNSACFAEELAILESIYKSQHVHCKVKLQSQKIEKEKPVHRNPDSKIVHTLN